MFRCTQADRSFTRSDFKRSMESICTSTVSQDARDECPLAYKDPQTVIKAWHRNKNHRLGMLLGGSASENALRELLDNSYSLAEERI